MPTKSKHHLADLPDGWTLEYPPHRMPQYRVVIRNELREEVAVGQNRSETIGLALRNKGFTPKEVTI